MKTTAKVISVLLVLACLCGCLFTITASATPTTVTLTTDKTTYAVNETVTFTSSSNGNLNNLWVYRVDGQWQDTILSVPATHTMAFGWAGEYKALVEAWDNTGALQSSVVYFTVGDSTSSGGSGLTTAPTYATVSISSVFVQVGQQVTFTIDSDGDKNTLWIYYPDGTSKYFEDVGTSYTTTFTQLGQYEYRVQAWNGYGNKLSHEEKADGGRWPGFTVINPTTTKPTTAAPTTAKPTTAAPTTVKPTAAPTTVKPTAAPTTVKPTAAPTTVKPTAAPTTVKPTAAPTTVKPTAAPTTVKPTAAPTTVKPTTAAPTTAAPTTAAPSTVAPTTAKPVTVKPTNKVVKPNSAAVITDKQTYGVDAPVTFICSGNGTSHTLWIYYPNGTQKSYSNVGATYTLSFNVPGMYGALLQAKNSAGTFESQAVTFMVELNAPTQPTEPTTPPETQPTTPPVTEPEELPSWLTRPSSAPQATQPSGNGGSSNTGSFWLWFWLALILFVIFIVIAIVLLAKRKKNNQEG